MEKTRVVPTGYPAYRISGLFWYPGSGRIYGFICRISGQISGTSVKKIVNIASNDTYFFI